MATAIVSALRKLTVADSYTTHTSDTSDTEDMASDTEHHSEPATESEETLTKEI